MEEYGEKERRAKLEMEKERRKIETDLKISRENCEGLSREMGELQNNYKK